MRPNKVEKAAVAALEDIKASHITLLDTRPLTAMYDSIIVATAESARQTKALARHVRDKVIEAGGQVLSIEGENTGEWVLVDCTELVVHIMLPTTRALYNLEELWTAPTHIRRAKVAVDTPAPAAARPAIRATKGKAPLLTKTAERKAAKASKAAAVAIEEEAPPTPVVKKAATKKPATKAAIIAVTEEKPAAKKAATKTAAAKKPAAKKPAAKAPAVKKVVVKKPAPIAAAPAPKMTPIKRPSTKKAR